MIDHHTIAQTADNVIDILTTIGVPEQAVTQYATITAKGTALREQEVVQCFMQHVASNIQVITAGTVANTMDTDKRTVGDT
jgi:hypothetical protein